MAAAKAVHCSAYQWCEHSSWEDSQACRLVHALRDAILRGLAAYDAMPWGFDRPEHTLAWTWMPPVLVR